MQKMQLRSTVPCSKQLLRRLLGLGLLSFFTACCAYTVPLPARSRSGARSSRFSRALSRPEDSTSKLWQEPARPVVPEAALDWVSGLFDGSAVSSQRLALPEATRLLMAIGPIMGMAAEADAAGLASVADVIEVLDAQELIREGQAATASLMQNNNLIELQLALEDGTERIITLFKQEPATR
eukprot:gb/GFBE01064071.1/.p1 GENE.gb/GFBE01064071.1/~~gb/GFBE01064071.1/.p1  ORF type:complete len:182 (+),score=53.78 gb/GFBE01064071.1/:1-546(+)